MLVFILFFCVSSIIYAQL